MAEFERLKQGGLPQRLATVLWRQMVIAPAPSAAAKAAARAKADSLRAEIKAGADFERVAKRESMDLGHQGPRWRSRLAQARRPARRAGTPRVRAVRHSPRRDLGRYRIAVRISHHSRRSGEPAGRGEAASDPHHPQDRLRRRGARREACRQSRARRSARRSAPFDTIAHHYHDLGRRCTRPDERAASRLAAAELPGLA